MTISTASPSQSTKENWAERWRDKLVDPALLTEWAAQERAAGRTIATLNGSFDLLHAGHLHILYEASCQADRLLLALNTDASIRGYKGELRPLVALEHRLQMVAALQFVDAVTWFDEATPCALLERVRPDVHVNGAEYGENCVEAEVVRQHGGRIHIVTLVPGLSTTQLLERVKRCG